MSRVHDALRRAEQMGLNPLPPTEERPADSFQAEHPGGPERSVDLTDLLLKVPEIPFNVSPDVHLIDINNPHDMPGEEFRSLRTRLNHIKTQQTLNSLVVTSASPAEGKTFTAVNLALVQAQLSENSVLLADIDLRRPTIHSLFQTGSCSGVLGLPARTSSA